MAGTQSAPFLLRTVRTEDLQDLSHALWGWQYCTRCRDKSECGSTTCPWSRANRLHTFWGRYKELTEAYAPEYSDPRPALASHSDLLKIVRAIHKYRNVPRNQLLRQLFAIHGNIGDQAALLDQNRAMNIAASIVFLTNCGTSLDCPDFLEEEGSSVPWRDDATAVAFASELYPKTNCLLVSEKFGIEKLTAYNLAKAGVQLEPTCDMRQHLALGHRGNKKVIRVFHCAVVLKEMLSAPHASNSTRLLPRALALEVLDTLYHVIFPRDVDSQTTLSTLIRKQRFDNELRQYEQSRYKRDDDPDVDYSYFGNQMTAIYEELQNPTSRPGWESWFQKYSAQRYMLMATMIGVFIAVLLGVLGLGVSAFQAWVSYQQWKHPVKEA